jgi:flagellar biosynthesis/type III secretory pathway protein FliH
MSTSSRAGTAAPTPVIEEPQEFIYQPVNGSRDSTGADTVGRGKLFAGMPWTTHLDTDRNDECAAKYTENDLSVREKQSWEAGFQEGENRACAECAQAVEAERAKVNLAIESFQQERESYYQRVEGEVVRLALAIAHKILHREAQVDPLVLAGVAHVALEKISSGSKVRLRVPPAQTGKWQETLAASENLRPSPELVADSTLSSTQLILETEVGTADLSLEAQLKEIEHGFLDLLALRPDPKQQVASDQWAVASRRLHNSSADGHGN